MSEAIRTINQDVILEMENYRAEMGKALFHEYDGGRSYDLILKTGPEKSQWYCHRLILALSSDFLRKIIETAVPGTTPVLILPDIKTSVVKYLLLYMYKGEVHIPTEDYLDFIDACNLLELKGPVNNDHPPSIVNCPIPDDALDLPALDISASDPELDEIQDESVFYPDQDMEDDSNDLSYQNHPGNYLEGSFEGTINEGKYPKQRRRRLYNTKQQKISITPHEIVDVTQRLKNIIGCLYQSFGISHLYKAEGIRLIMEGDKLLQGEHSCELCSRAIGVSYMINKRRNCFNSWINTSVRYHLIRVHNLQPLVLNNAGIPKILCISNT